MVDAYMLLSYGGPNKPEDVVPFLRNAVAGRGVPDERLAEVGKHYYRFGGKSPINELNAALADRLRAELEARGDRTPVVVGNRNWHPFGHETLAELYDAGARSVRAVATAAFCSYSGCRQYSEDLERWRAQLGHADLRVEKIHPFWQATGFYVAYREVVREARAKMPDARLVFVTHSIPTAMNAAAGPPAYDVQHRQLIERLCAELGEQEWDLAYCSRSGSPHVPWLEPDINDHLEAIAGEGASAAIVVPIGFISDHMEVVYDLDIEARATAERLGMGYLRAPTIDRSPTFIAQLADLLQQGPADSPADCCHPTPPAALRANPERGMMTHPTPANDAVAHPAPDHPAPTHPGSRPSPHGHPRGEVRPIAKQLNEERPFVMWSVFKADQVGEAGAGAFDPARIAAAEDAVWKTGVSVRGYYDVSGFRADADLMAWFVAKSAEAAQAAYRVLHRGLALTPVWSALSQHRPAEYNPDHLPGMFEHEPERFASVYPFVRSYDWYLLEDWKRAAIMRNHAAAGRPFDDLVTSTLASFSLSDYEWVVALEGEDLTRIVDLMYAFRKTEARLYVRQDVPFFTGERVELAEWARRQGSPLA